MYLYFRLSCSYLGERYRTNCFEELLCESFLLSLHYIVICSLSFFLCNIEILPLSSS